jgi:hypothetical protein
MSAYTNLPDVQKEFIEKILYILTKTGGIDYYRLFKVLYFAEREYLTTVCRKLVADDFCALPHGPVPTRLFDAIKGDHYDDFSKAIGEVVSFAGEDASNVLVPNRAPELSMISRLEMDVIDRTIDKYASLSFAELRRLSHGLAWNATSHCEVISSENIAREGGLHPDALPYLRDQLDLYQYSLSM